MLLKEREKRGSIDVTVEPRRGFSQKEKEKKNRFFGVVGIALFKRHPSRKASLPGEEREKCV